MYPGKKRPVCLCTPSTCKSMHIDQGLCFFLRVTRYNSIATEKILLISPWKRMLNRDFHIIPHSNLRHPYQPEGLRPSGWYGFLGLKSYENCHIIICLSYIFLSDTFAYLILYAKSKASPPSALYPVPNVYHTLPYLMSCHSLKVLHNITEHLQELQSTKRMLLL